MIVQVALISPKHIIDRSFDYIVPKELEDAVKGGIRVLVPLVYIIIPFKDLSSVSRKAANLPG